MKKTTYHFLLFLLVFLPVWPCFSMENDSLPNPDWTAFVRERAIPLELHSDDAFSDLDELKKAIGNKRIVLLGESTHGAKEFNQMKVRLIRFLHREMGFQVLAFESGIAELLDMEMSRKRIPADYLIYRGITGVWHTREYLPLMHYLKDNPDLLVVGFDPQTFARNFKKYLNGAFQNLGPEQADHAYLVDSLGKQWLRNVREKIKLEKEDLRSEYDKIVSGYRELLHSLEMNRATFQKKGMSDRELKLLEMGLRNRLQLIAYKTYIPGSRQFAHRDSLMAENLAWICQVLYPNKKVIVTAHNTHIRKDHPDLQVMGEYLPKDLQKQSYGIGIYMYSGASTLNNRKVAEVQPALAGSLEQLLNQTGYPISFLDFSNTKRNRKSRFLFRDIKSYYWGKDLEMIQLKKAYEGLLFFEKTTIPEFLY